MSIYLYGICIHVFENFKSINSTTCSRPFSLNYLSSAKNKTPENSTSK